MPLSCAAYGCTNHNKMENKPGFFRFPNNDPELRQKWINACKRKNVDGSPWCPKGKNVYICGHHFVTGQPNRKDPSHPDHVPSLFIYVQSNPEKQKRKVERFNSAQKRRKINNESIAASKEPEEPITTEAIAENSSAEKVAEEDLPVNVAPESSHEVEISELMFEMNNLREERDKALAMIQDAKKRFLSYDSLKLRSEDKFKYYTGLTSATFDILFSFLEHSLPDKSRSKMHLKDQLLMTLVKLRLDIQFENLGDQFNCPKSSAHDIFKRRTHLMYYKLKFLIKSPDHDASRETLPHVFAQYFPRLTHIIDCTEIFIDRPKNLKARAQVYSNYKKHSTVKFFIACTPLGAISSISKAWGGRVSDVELVKNSGFISYKYHTVGDQVLADRGFTLVDEFAAGCGVELITPSFTKGKKQLSAREVETSRQIASIRIHIERVIGLVKNRYRILDGTLSTTLVKSLSDEANELDVSGIDRLFTVCAALCNLSTGIVYNEDKNKA